MAGPGSPSRIRVAAQKLFPHSSTCWPASAPALLRNFMPPPLFIIIAIDGGAASGKSSSANILSDRFNLLHVDTGSFYRHITYELLRRGVAHTDLAALKGALGAPQLTTP